MFAEQTVTALPLLRLHSEFTDSLPRSRTPLEVLTALAAEGAEHGLDLWGMAVQRTQGASVCVCSQAPLAPGVGARQLSHFIESANELARGAGGADWSGAATQLICLQPQLPEIDPGLVEYRDIPVDTGGVSPTLIRAAALHREADFAPNWSKLDVMVRYAGPYLRALERHAGHTAHGMLDLDSGTHTWPCFLDALEREVARAQRQRSELALAVLELRALAHSPSIPPPMHRLVGGHMAHIVRRTDLVGRIGSTTYAVLLHNTGPRPALIAAGRIAEALREDEEVRSCLSFSLGVSGWEGEGLLEVSTLLSQAQEAAADAAHSAPGKAFVYV